MLEFWKAKKLKTFDIATQKVGLNISATDNATAIYLHLLSSRIFKIAKRNL